MARMCWGGVLAAACLTLACSQLRELGGERSGSPRYDTDVLIPVVLESANQPASFPIELDEPRHVTLRSYFPPAPVSVVLRDAEGREVSTRGRPLIAPGRYTLELSSPRPVPEEFHVKVLTSPERLATRQEIYPTDDNAAAERALPLPFGTALRLRIDEERPEHWFRLAAPEAGIVLVRLEGRNGETQATLQLQNASGAGIPSTAGRSESGQALYARTEAGDYLLQIVDAAPRRPGAAGTEAKLHVDFRPPGYRASGGVGIMTIGMEVEAAQQGSLGFIAEATGLPLVPTFSADDILWVLATAIGEELGTNPAWALPAFIGVAALLYALAGHLRRQRLRFTRMPTEAAEESP